MFLLGNNSLFKSYVSISGIFTYDIISYGIFTDGIFTAHLGLTSFYFFAKNLTCSH